MIDKGGHVTDALRVALKAGDVPLPPTLAVAAATLVRERLTRLARKLKITDVATKRPVQLNLHVLNGHVFQELWKRISTKTTYRVRFDDAVLIATCA